MPARGNDFHGNRKLTEQEVIEIYLAQGTAEFIAMQYGVSRSTVWSIKEGRNWSWLTKDLKNKNNEENDVNE